MCACNNDVRKFPAGILVSLVLVCNSTFYYLNDLVFWSQSSDSFSFTNFSNYTSVKIGGFVITSNSLEIFSKILKFLESNIKINI